MRRLDTDKFLSAYNNAMLMDRRLVQNITGALANTNFDRFVSLAQQVTLPTETVGNIANVFSSTISDVSYPILNLYQSEITDDEKEEADRANKKIITEIFQPDMEKKIDINESPVIVLSDSL